MISLSSTQSMLDALRTAKDITFSSYFLPPDGAVATELAAAAKRGAHVVVRLSGDFDRTNSLLRDNKRAIERLHGANVDAQIIRSRKDDGRGLHLKAAVCDGSAFLDDRNWSGRDVVIRETNRDTVLLIKEAAAYATVHCDAIALTKADALRCEVSALATARTKHVDVESETMSRHSPVYAKLLRLAAKGIRCRVLLSSRRITGDTAAAAATLQKAHVAVRFINSSDKIAVNGKHAWVGSANATSAWLDRYQTDWGLSTRNPHIVRALQAHFNENWRAAAFVNAPAAPDLVC